MHNNDIRTWMTPTPITISPNDTVINAYRLMKHNHIRRLPVLDVLKLVGVITISDVRSISPLGALPILEQNDLVAQTKIARLMTPNPITVSPEENLGEAARLMMKHKISGLPVLEEDQLIGVISEADIFRFVIAENWISGTHISAGTDGEDPIQLRNGQLINIRSIRPDDAPKLQDSFAQLSPETIYDRFMGYKKVLPDREARFLTSLDYDSHMALVAVTQEDNIVGVARYHVLDDEPDCAEFAIVISDNYQRQGLGSYLMLRLMEYAHLRGIHTFLGFAHSENYRLIRFIQRSGLPIERKLKGGLWEVRVTLEGIAFPNIEEYSHQMD